MSTLKSLLVHVDASPQAAVRLKLAEQLALAHGAQATAVYAVTSALLRYPMAMAAGADMAPMLAEVDAQRLESARKLYAASVQPAQVRWQECTGAPIADITQQAFCSDLLVLGQRAADETRDIDVPADFVSSVLIASGRPAIVVPHIARAPLKLDRVLVAWKPTRESARAVTAALPLLQQAASVTVVAFDEGDSPAEETGIVGYLRQHGVQAAFRREVASETSVGDQLLSLAADEQSNLLVMGCYGHGRAREWVLGGVSRTVITSMTIPVLMCH
ncbi:universal stress protein [Piscinibacter aquaticus]|uniref:Universal stress protein n=1 Tax=Piscinibacter aquaticus TaxID=392597 RepID=A0A5C6U4J3_9BURK|nr:universal stress protein [Piscinibacter aquaticus]